MMMRILQLDTFYPQPESKDTLVRAPRGRQRYVDAVTPPVVVVFETVYADAQTSVST